MNEKFDLIEILMYFARKAHIEEIKLGDYNVLYLLEAVSKNRMEYFVFDAADVEGLSDDEIKNIVKSSPLVKSDFQINKYKEGRYRYVRFNRFPLYTRMDLFTKIFLNITKDAKIQRDFCLGTYWWGLDPVLHKHIWWVFHKGVKSENIQELMDSNESRFLDKDKAMEFANSLREKNEPYAFIHKGYPRLGSKTCNYERLKVKYSDVEFVSPLEDDDEKEEILSLYEKIKAKGMIHPKL